MVENPEELLANIIKGDEKAFNLFYKETYGRSEVKAIMITKNIPDAQDVVSESYFKVWRTIGEGKEFDNLAHLQNYLYVTVHNTAVTLVKRRPKNIQDFESLEEIVDENSTQLAEEIYRLELYAKIVKAVSLLKPSQYRTILELSIHDRKSAQEIAVLLQLKVNNVIKQRASGMKKLIELAKSFYYLCQAVIILYFVVIFFLRWISKM